ncbi:hypothetical protein HWV62_18116 [Athelia sp. TMB]|nr:hypothetical protein HWV62_18116 [Athelia sp. TMB]
MGTCVTLDSRAVQSAKLLPRSSSGPAPKSRVTAVQTANSVNANHFLGVFQVLGALEKKTTGPRPDYFFALHVNEKMVLRSEKVPRDAPRWAVEKPPRFNLTSTIKIAVYRLTPTGQRLSSKKFFLAECKVRGIDLLGEAVELGLTNEAGAKIVPRLAVELDVALEPRADFMKTVDKEIARLSGARGTDGAQLATTVCENIGTALQKIVPIIDRFAVNHPSLRLAWIALSSAYKAAQSHIAKDAIVRDLVESLCSMISVASACQNLLDMEDAANIINAIGRTSVDVALLIHQYADTSSTRKASVSPRAAKPPLPDISSKIAEFKRQCAELTTKLSPRSQIHTEPEAEAVGDGVRGNQDELNGIRGDPVATSSQLNQSISTGPTFNAIGTSGTVTMVAGNYIEGDCHTAQEGLYEIQDAMKLIKEEKKAINEWMAAPDTSPTYKAAREKHQRGTGSWLVDGSIFEKWKAHPDSVLWLHGGPGCGKTIICSSAIENVKKSCRNKGLVGYAYFFFDGTSAQSKLAAHESMIRSLIMQFSDRLDWIHPALADLYDLEDKGRHQPLISSLEDTLLEIIKTFTSAYIIIDALDECAEQRKLLTWIQYITSQTSSSLHLLVTSRLEPDIKSCLRTLSTIEEMAIADEQASSDIREYINARLSEVDGWTETQKELVRVALSRGAGGVFRWVALQFDQLLLKRCLSTAELEQRLMSLPKDLDAAYTKIIEQSPRPADLIRFLQWIIFGQREFTAKELAEVALINFDNGSNTVPFCDSSRRYGSPDDVLRACSGLVVEVKMWPGKITSYADEEMLAHLSVKEFLLSAEIPLLHTHSIRTNECLSHGVLAQTCLAYLLQFDKHESITKANAESFPLAEYASKHCVFHVEQSIRSEDRNSTLKRLIEHLAALDTPYALIHWTWLQGRDETWDYVLKRVIQLDNAASSLYYASIIGLTPLVDHLIKRGSDVNELGGRWETALKAAAGDNHLEICKLLLEHGADVNATSERAGTALQLAASQPNPEFCQLLLEHGADVNATAGIHGTALQEASRSGHLEICQLLLEHGADVNAMGGGYGFAFQAKMCERSTGLFRILSKETARGASGTALQVASYRNRPEVCQLLLEQGADVNATGAECGTALHVASVGGHPQICQLLLKHGADVNATGGMYGTALQAALAKAHFKVIRLLLEHGADVNATGGQYGTALQAVSSLSCDPFSSHRLLQEEGVDVNNIEGPDGGYHRDAVSCWVRLEICQLLLELGADVNGTGGEYGTALQAASYKNHPEICQLLLERGADVNVIGGKYGTALQAASCRGHIEICQLLLDKGADVNALGGEYCTALQAASYQGYLEICQLFLEQGADVNATGGECGTALNAARVPQPWSWPPKSEAEIEEMVQLLKQYGAVETVAPIQPDEN